MSKLQSTLDILNHEDNGSKVFHNWKIEISEKNEKMNVMVSAKFYYKGEKQQIRETYKFLNESEHEHSISWYYQGGEEEIVNNIGNIPFTQMIYNAFRSEFNLVYKLVNDE